MAYHVKRIVIVISVFIGVLVITALSIALVYEKQVKKIIIGQINKQLITPVEVGEIKFSLIKNFPKASLSFYHVSASSVYYGNEKASCPKTLFSAKEISLQFNLKDLFNGNYTINKIELNDANLFLFIDNEHHDNYHCWKTDSTKSESSVSFKMNQIVLHHFNTSFSDLKQQLDFEILLQDAQMKGEIFNQDFAFGIEFES